MLCEQFLNEHTALHHMPFPSWGPCPFFREDFSGMPPLHRASRRPAHTARLFSFKVVPQEQLDAVINCVMII